ncbi:MAG: Dyp-type peroxidase [Deltaproteobacteria bacterium]|jgi:putative iron-dependent peroxidase|nr:Dyp-type peroxidase [Deltaproteobacteria bacterium]
MHAQDVTFGAGKNAIFLVFGLNKPDEIGKIKGICEDAPSFVRSLRNRFCDDQISCVVGFGSAAWDHLFKGRKKPKELAPFQEIKGDKHTAPSTPGDLFFHIRSTRFDLAYELASLITEALGDSVLPIEEIHGFRYLDGRAILGFVDGTENPDIPDERYDFAVIGDQEPDFKGGSYCFVQKYIHNMVDWNKLPTEEQEKVIGRRKYNDKELSDEEKPENAHNAVTNISDENGEELKIVRGNMPFANPSKGEYGTYFIGYASTFTTTKRMLDNMFKGDPPGNYDRILDFSTAETGTLFFIPSLELLGELAADEE